VVEEEGAGLRANIGIRGLDPHRSRNVLILEDGIPVALNPYGEPDSYYTPQIDRR
jgi:Fe(3+) dicitrate transport protein